jgi:2-C-methyl-D-erythritol 2,4-cyclodiphosphate synthase
MKIGQGFDAHRFCEGQHLMLGGVKIAHDKGIEAHSDGDVLLHAICDALLGAAGLGDIGSHFSDQENINQNRDSREFVRSILELITQQDLVIANIDATIICQQPKISPHKASMQKIIAEDLQCDLHQVNIKATTTEKMGFTGRQEGIAAMAVALLQTP